MSESEHSSEDELLSLANSDKYTLPPWCPACEAESRLYYLGSREREDGVVVNARICDECETVVSELAKGKGGDVVDERTTHILAAIRGETPEKPVFHIEGELPASNEVASK